MHDQQQHSPCNGFCLMDNQTKLCMGCFRTIDEIIKWQSLDKNDKETIYKNIEQRKNKFKSGSSA